MLYTSATAGPQGSVVYYNGSPNITRYSAGSRSWRTNNPGLLGLGVLTARHGAIGQALGVAVFRNPQQGRNALLAVLDDESFAALKVKQVLALIIPLYKPPRREKDTIRCEPDSWLEPETGLDLELRLSAMNGTQRKNLAGLIERRLHYVPGLITHESFTTGSHNQSDRARIKDHRKVVLANPVKSTDSSDARKKATAPLLWNFNWDIDTSPANRLAGRWVLKLDKASKEAAQSHSNKHKED